MRLPDFLQWSGLNQLRAEMGQAPLGSTQVSRGAATLTEAELEALMQGGVEIGSIDEVSALPDGTLHYKNQRVLVYIRDVSNYGHKKDAVSDLPRFHFSNCRTLLDMRQKKRSHRYVVASREDGRFLVNLMDGELVASRLAPLNVCQNCLDHLQFNGFSHSLSQNDKKARVKRFSLKEFFEQYPRTFIVRTVEEDDLSAPLNAYSSNHDEVAAEIKRRRGYRCEACHRDLSAANHRRYLNLHHVDGRKYNNSEDNLRVLCIRCHAREPLHNHVKVPPEFDKLFPHDSIGHNRHSWRVDMTVAIPVTKPSTWGHIPGHAEVDPPAVRTTVETTSTPSDRPSASKHQMKLRVDDFNTIVHDIRKKHEAEKVQTESSSIYCHQCGGDGGAGGRCFRCGGNGLEP